ncbi:hypothetical protein GAF [Cupriavidus necator N-1]|uniref:GAF domain-containing protein n=1 Tax=Cupriavidus necator (strain ATCC 43291 / DSM 13513 / CCUG 52238 / LMG 8453 / N-1) TaxID=1042878 RepID=F8GS00_CUPNN|nr:MULTISPECIES: GAF domain-containing protein [Cupriavidus]AEI80939.1 hypothetical protein GAF [Cupriavidus necator N-1]KAI3600069.1 hypothetical protein D8I24_4457 [Cupriavidus necator H850]MDX6009435.1 GAF domain-containing protein [Cupriavidus necator]QUN31166.1 GAF domain-containing protein [Cupriavidus sp. KK10]
MEAILGNPQQLIAQVNRLCDALQRAASPLATLDAIGHATMEMLGPGLLTINAWYADAAQIERLWSSSTTAYPVGGRKTKGDSPWKRQLLERGEVFVGEGDAALAEVFDDIDTIRSLGCRAVVNVPLCHAGRVIGTFNYLADRSVWSGAELAALRTMANLTVLAVKTRLASTE